MKTNFKYSYIVILLSIIITILLYNDLLIHPNSYLFNSNGDGIKNYYTVDYYVKHNQQWLYTQGLNYPYSELLIYTDNQPIVSILLKKLSNYFPIIKENVIGILNFLMLISISFTSFFIFKICNKIGLPVIYSIVTSLIVSFLSPQVERFTGHYGLSYAFFVPMVWYLLIRLKENDFQLNYYLLINLILVLFAFVHPYYLLIGTVFVFIFGIVDFIYNPKSYHIKKLITHFVLSLLPILLVQIIINYFDNIVDRPSNPWGILSYIASFEGLFLPVYSPFLDYWNMLVKVRATNIESRNYVGILGTITLILITIKAIKYLLNKKIKFILKPILPDLLRTSLLTAFLILIFAMAFPFRIGLDFLLEIFPTIKQFRSLGRFAWVFYYVFTIYSAYYFYLIFRKWKIESKKYFAFILISLLMTVWMFEAYINNSRNIQLISNREIDSYKDYRFIDSLRSYGFTLDSFQSVLPLPGYFIGSEVTASDLNSVTSFKSMSISALSGLPINSVMLSRTSFNQTLISSQLFSDTLNDKSNILNLLGSQKILVIKDKSDLKQYTIETKSKHLFSDEKLHYYVLNAQDLKKSEYSSSGKEFIINNEGITKHSDNFVFFEKSKQINDRNQTLFEKEIKSDSILICTFLIKASNKESFPCLYLNEFDSDNKLIRKTEYRQSELMNNTIDYIRLKTQFSISTNTKNIELVLDSKSTELKSLIISNIDTVFMVKENDKIISVDNYYL